jgi:hypothetical protein
MLVHINFALERFHCVREYRRIWWKLCQFMVTLGYLPMNGHMQLIIFSVYPKAQHHLISSPPLDTVKFPFYFRQCTVYLYFLEKNVTAALRPCDSTNIQANCIVMRGKIWIPLMWNKWYIRLLLRFRGLNIFSVLKQRYSQHNIILDVRTGVSKWVDVIFKDRVYFVLTSCGLVDVHWLFDGTYYPYLHGRRGKQIRFCV